LVGNEIGTGKLTFMASMRQINL